MSDCSKTVEFLRELTRMCGSFEFCLLGCPLRTEDSGGPRCGFSPDGSNDNTIAIVQKWSDEHPEMTWAGKLRKLLPNANVAALSDLAAQTRGIHLCPSDVFGESAPNWRNGCNWECAECWNGEYKEAER